MLWPDLRAAWFRATIRKADRGSIEAFLQQYGTLKPARELRYRYALACDEIGEILERLALFRKYDIG